LAPSSTLGWRRARWRVRRHLFLQQPRILRPTGRLLLSAPTGLLLPTAAGLLLSAAAAILCGPVVRSVCSRPLNCRNYRPNLPAGDSEAFQLPIPTLVFGRRPRWPAPSLNLDARQRGSGDLPRISTGEAVLQG